MAARGKIWTVGYGAWAAPVRADRLVKALADQGMTRLVDVRLAPCSADLDPARTYGPRPWHLQASGEAGIVALLGRSGIAYEWIVELGNPQRQDPSMAVLHAHLADPSGDWPVHRGLARLADRVREPREAVCLLCACAEANRCHRTVMAQALNDRFFEGELEIIQIGRQ
ncbi:DUF488 domain-containing protein [Tautonia sp. JC769]|uniref:DUF488 domain-containing protein n=1 Tax=Tautonia sp. JC769 TaxID=3232135 RepID=UPI003458D7E0